VEEKNLPNPTVRQMRRSPSMVRSSDIRRCYGTVTLTAWYPEAPEGIGGAFSAVSEPHPLRLVKESRASKPSGQRALLRKRRWGRLFSHVVAYRAIDVYLVGLRNGW
jgi:hypothetical protein